MLLGFEGEMHMVCMRECGKGILDVGRPLAMVMIVFVQEERADQIQSQAEAADDQNQLRVLDVLDGDEALDGLKCNTQTERKKKDAVEKGAK